MKRFRFTTVMLLLIFCLLPIVSITMIHHLTLTDTLSKMGTGSLGTSYSFITVQNNDKAYENIISVLNTTNTKFALYYDSTDENGSTVREIYFNKSYANLPMKSGRFFIARDFTDGNNTAVVGKGKEDSVYTKGNKKYISVNGKGYEVLGVIGYNEKTIFDNYIFINMRANNLTSKNMFTIDYMSENNAQALTNMCIEKLETQQIQAEIRTIGENYSESIMPKVLSARWFIGLLICCFLCLLLVSVQWINRQKTEVCIRRLTGAAIKDIIFLIAGKYAAIALISYAAGFLYCCILYPAYLRFLAYGYALCTAFILIFMLWSVCILLSEPIEEAIK